LPCDTKFQDAIDISGKKNREGAIDIPAKKENREEATDIPAKKKKTERKQSIRSLHIHMR
jgi:hypothetical protein